MHFLFLLFLFFNCQLFSTTKDFEREMDPRKFLLRERDHRFFSAQVFFSHSVNKVFYLLADRAVPNELQHESNP